MIVLVIVLAVLSVAAIVLVLVTRSRLAAQRTAHDAAAAVAAQTAAERDAEQARAAAAEAARDEAATRADTAEARAAEADGKATDAATKAAAADARAVEAEARAAEAAALAADAAARNGLDPEVLWTLERARSERTWRHSVALGADSVSVFDGTDHPLREALQVELDAAREDVGAIVDLDLDVPADVTAAGSVLVLRAAQELLARAVKAAEQTILHVLADGQDVVVTVEASDEDGTPVAVEPLAVPASADLEATDGGVRIKRAIPA
jgi:predicted lipid-binding transport protein (Tim44 family)